MKKSLLVLSLGLFVILFGNAQVANQPGNLEFCDDNNDGFVTFNLTTLDAQVLSGQSAVDYEVTYYLTLSDALSYTNALNANSFTNSSSPQIIYIRVTELASGNYDTTTTTLEVFPIPFTNPPMQLTSCDPNNDGIGVFNLNDASLSITSEPATEVTYHLTHTNALDDILALVEPELSNYMNYEDLTQAPNNLSYSQIIWVRVDYLESTSDCSTVLPLELLVNETPVIAGRDLLLALCDNTTPINDSMADFDLTVMDNQITGSDASLTVDYYENPADVLSNTPIADYTVYTGTANQTLQVVVTAMNGCTDRTTLTLRVLSIPSPTTAIPNTVLCDDAVADGITLFDLTDNGNGAGSQETFIISGQLPTPSLTYHLEATDAELGINSIPDPTMHENTASPNSQLIYVRVTSGNVDTFGANCYTVVIFAIVVDPSPTINTPTPFELCDDDNDGFAQFDLSTKIDEITNGATDFLVSFYGSLVDAENQTNELPLVFQNDINPQTIYVRRVSNLASSCYVITQLELRVIDCTALGQIQLNAFLDEDLNGMFDTDEFNFMNGYFTYELNNDGIINTVSTSTGQFTILSQDENDTYDITYNLYSEFDNCYDITTAIFENIGVNNGSIVTYDFPVIEEQSCVDLAIYLVSSFVPPRPGFNYYNYLYIENQGQDEIASGTIEFVHDALLSFNNTNGVNPNYTVTPTATGFTLDFVNLQAGETEFLEISMLCPASVALGELVTNTATYSVNDLDTANNTSSISEIVVGSFDPNDKMESHGGKIILDDFTATDYLFYTIRFQNVGTADAINVRIEDLLDNDLDETSLRMLKSSHNYVLTQTANQLIWKFDNINLPSETDDEPNSHGFVYFKIKPKVGYAIGDIIPNTADIYFDFNAAVVTNTFNTEFIASLSVNEFANNVFILYPNPARNLVTLQLSKVFAEKTSLTVFDIQGKQVLNSSIEANTISSELNTSNLEAGIYFVKLKNSNSELIKKLVIE